MMFTRKEYKTITLGILMACLSILLFGCTGGTDDPGISQEGLSINLISPSIGIPGDTVAIHGVNFSSEAVVTFGPHPASILEVSNYKIMAIVPEGISGNTPVFVSFQGKASNSLAFLLQEMETMELADPTIFLHDNTYYVYGTAGRGGDVNRGFLVYSSPDLRKWNGPRGVNQGFSLVKENSFGDWGFWAPQVFEFQGEIYMAYTANENMAIAKSQSPLGPFVEHAVLTGPTNQIDPYIFFDDDGKIYIYYVKLSGGNKIHVAEMNEDLTAIKQETSLLCIEATDGWEVTDRIRVAEGPTVLKQEGKYYLFYSTNHFENRDYAVGYAVSDSPMGPWTRFNGNPILNWGMVGAYGTGHGDFFIDKNGEYRYVFHTHYDNSRVQPRLTAIINGEFSAASSQSPPVMSLDRETFKYLLINN